jgi:hypothetical protein
MYRRQQEAGVSLFAFRQQEAGVSLFAFLPLRISPLRISAIHEGHVMSQESTPNGRAVGVDLAGFVASRVVAVVCVRADRLPVGRRSGVGIEDRRLVHVRQVPGCPPSHSLRRCNRLRWCPAGAWCVLQKAVARVPMDQVAGLRFPPPFRFLCSGDRYFCSCVAPTLAHRDFRQERAAHRRLI